MALDQTKMNADYQDVLNKVYGGQISLRGRYVNPKAVLQHHCRDCKTEFWARPFWLVNKRQPHECFALPADSLKSGKTPKKATGRTKGTNTPKVSEEMRLEMVQLYQQGGSLNSIAKQFAVTAATVKNHLKKAGVKLRA